MSVVSRARQTVRSRAVRVAHAAENGLRDVASGVATRAGWRPAPIPYSGYAGPSQARVLARVVLSPASVDPAARRGIAAWRRLLTLECPSAEVRVELAGSTTVVVSDAGGIVDAALPLREPLGAEDAEALLHVPGRAPARVPVHVVASTRGVVCDIDDTVWVTGLAHPLQAARRTFLGTSSTRKAVPGMAALVREAVHGEERPAVVYLSNGPWNFAGIASRFLRKNGFPSGALLMTDWGTTPTRWFRDGKAHKGSSLRRLHEDLPDVTWVLVGDDGEHDPDLYAAFTREHPDSVAAVALRQVAPAAGGAHAETVSGVPVLRGSDGDALLPLLRDALGRRGA